ncbi:hypothetical protein J6590_072732 [Homalodisca vitripennis]|nr:hypothetical protein J6590_072732 [Homalodisca vitripennis]
MLLHCQKRTRRRNRLFSLQYRYRHTHIQCSNSWLYKTSHPTPPTLLVPAQLTLLMHSHNPELHTTDISPYSSHFVSASSVDSAHAFTQSRTAHDWLTSHTHSTSHPTPPTLLVPAQLTLLMHSHNPELHTTDISPFFHFVSASSVDSAHALTQSPLCLASEVKCTDTGTENFDPCGVQSAWPQQSNVEIRRCSICLASAVKCRDTVTENFDPAGVQSAWPQQYVRYGTENFDLAGVNLLGLSTVFNLLGLSSHVRYGTENFDPAGVHLLASAVKCRDTGTENFDPAGVQSAWPQQSNVEIRELRISTRVFNLLGLRV